MEFLTALEQDVEISVRPAKRHPAARSEPSNEGAGGPPFSASILASHFRTVGAPSLRFLQGRVRCCLYYGLCA